MFEEDALRQAAALVRGVYARLLLDPSGRIDPEAARLTACVLLRAGLANVSQFDAKICGGDGMGDGGYIDERGRRHRHYWIEAQARVDSDLAFVLDVAADQFGADPIQVIPLPLARANYQPGEQAMIDRQVMELGFDQAATSRRSRSED